MPEEWLQVALGSSGRSTFAVPNEDMGRLKSPEVPQGLLEILTSEIHGLVVSILGRCACGLLNASPKL